MEAASVAAKSPGGAVRPTTPAKFPSTVVTKEHQAVSVPPPPTRSKTTTPSSSPSSTAAAAAAVTAVAAARAPPPGKIVTSASSSQSTLPPGKCNSYTNHLTGSKELNQLLHQHYCGKKAPPKPSASAVKRGKVPPPPNHVQSTANKTAGNPQQQKRYDLLIETTYLLLIWTLGIPKLPKAVIDQW